MKKLYAIRDNLADSIIGGVEIFAGHASATRWFSDVASNPQTSVGRHITDHELRCLGDIDEDTGNITPNVVTILTGAQLRAAQDAQKPEAQSNG